MGSVITLEDTQFESTLLVAEIRGASGFAFKYESQARIVFSKCEWCKMKAKLDSVCVCKQVRYCSPTCLEKDKRYHKSKCSAHAELELRELSYGKSEHPKLGLVGLANLGNTCYLNSSLQCLSSTFELTQFFLQFRFKFINTLPTKNKLGTEGRLVMAYAKTLNEMWEQDASVVRPALFKQVLGQYAKQFEGEGEQDAHECISSILDLLGEDLYRKGQKPYIQADHEKEAQLDQQQVSSQAWNRHLVRNESIITDLFHGQFKSTCSCPKCGQVSVTFDPLVTLLLPIPVKKPELHFFLIPYRIRSGYVNYWGSLRMNRRDTVMEMR